MCFGIKIPNNSSEKEAKSLMISGNGSGSGSGSGGETEMMMGDSDGQDPRKFNARDFIKKALGKARGSKAGLWFRVNAQKAFGFVDKCAGKRGGLLIFLGIVCFALSCIGIQKIKLDTTLDSLWTPDSGRLMQELNYVSRVSGLTTDTNEMLIQTPKIGADHSILHAKALLDHLEVLQKALTVTVDLYDITWSLKDLCYSANIPSFDVQFIDQIFEKIFPCVIITPLDCFWEGSKLLGPEYPIQIPGFRNSLKWTNLNPQDLLTKARMHPEISSQSFPFEILEGFMKRAGIGSGYQEKPCLNPLDPECPFTAPNKGMKSPPDVASILSEGCYGFAPRFMHWPPDLLVGGPSHNKSGNLIKAGGLMSTIQLMSSSELYEFFRETWRLHHVEWTDSKAHDVLTSWQNRFSNEVEHLSMDEEMSSKFNFHSFTPSGLDLVVENASQFSWVWCFARIIAIIILAVIVGTLFSGESENIKYRMGLVFGASLVALLGTAGGCGIAGFLSIPFNVASVQVLPYITISLVSQVFFILIHSQLNSKCDAKQTMKKHGFSLLLGLFAAAIFIGAGAIFPIPAVRSLSFQGAILVTSSSISICIIFTPICQLVLRKKRNELNSLDHRVKNSNNSTSSKCTNNSGGFSKNQDIPLIGKGVSFKNNNVTLLNNINPSTKTTNNELFKNSFLDKSASVLENPYDSESGEIQKPKQPKQRLDWISPYIKLIQWKWFTGIFVILYMIWIGFSLLGILRLRLGLPITDVVPANSNEWQFLKTQGKLFPVYHMRAVTKSNFDYPNNQKLLHKFHEMMSGLPWVIRDENGAAPPMWLSVFRSWLLRLQKVFDKEWELGHLHSESWTDLASADGILAWKLTVQTGHVEHPVDLTLLRGNRLVDNEGNINTRAFYVYLTAWAWNDPLAYGSTAANLKPEPRTWVHSPEDKDLKIPKSAPIKYAETTYLLRTIKDDVEDKDQETLILDFVREIRSICTAFESRGLPVFPWGIPFRFYEQYLNLPLNSGIVITFASGMTSFILFAALGFSLRPVGIVLITTIVTLVQIGGAIGWMKVGLSAFPVLTSLLGVSLVIFSTVQHIVAFCCIPGSINTRKAISFNLIGPPCVQSLILISSSALILYSPDFTFIFTQFTLLVSISALFSLANFLFLLPILFSIIKPRCWLVGNNPNDPSTIEPLTPSPIPKRVSNSKSHRSGGGRSSSTNSGGSNGRNSSRNQPPPYNFRGSRGSHYKNGSRAPSQNSLSTITEEPNSCATRRSSEIIVQPQFVVETFDQPSINGEPSSTKTKVKLKVEVHSTSHSNTTTFNSQSVNSSTNMSENSATNSSTSSSGSFSSSGSSATSSYNNERISDDFRE